VTGDVPSTADPERLMAEIDAEVRRRRVAGELTPAFERELDALFDAVSPPGVTGEFPALLDRAQSAAAINADPPVESARVGGGAAKRMLGRAMSWYVGHVTRQVGALGTALVEALRVLGDRVERLEKASIGTQGAVAAAAALDPHVDLAGWGRVVGSLLERTPGRVLHGDAGDGSLVRALADAGLDAYGVEPRVALADAAATAGLEVREHSTPEHLEALPTGALGGLVLSGCVDTLPLAELRELAKLAGDAVAVGGRVVVIATAPESWGRGDTTVAADLAPGRPLHPESWQHLLDAAGFAESVVVPGPTSREAAVTGVRTPA